MKDDEYYRINVIAGLLHFMEKVAEGRMRLKLRRIDEQLGFNLSLPLSIKWRENVLYNFFDNPT